MVRLINADYFREVLERYYSAPHVQLKSYFCEGMRMAIDSCIQLLESQKTVDARPMVHGRWELHGDDDSVGCSFFCSECGYCMCEEEYLDNFSSFRYCPYCGAKMDGDSQ